MSRRSGCPDGRSRIATAITFAALLALSLPISAFGQTQYTVRPVRTDSLVELRVVTAFRGSPEGTTRFSLPSDRFGVSGMHRWIRDVDLDAGTRLTEVETGVYTARHEPGAEVEISYTVAYDPEAAGFVAFGPSVGPDHFHFFGSQWMARVGEAEGLREIEVVFETEDWPGSVGSSYGLGAGPHRVEASAYDLDYSVIAGGEYRTDRSTCRGRPVVTMIHGSFDVSDQEIFDLTETIACGQREAFDDFDRPFFTVYVTEREGLTAGAPLLHGFTTFLETDTSSEELRGLLAHEMIHTWLPRTARLVDPARPDASEVWTRWFHEGFTEYLSRVVLVRRELAPRSWMVERTNRDLSRLAYHPYRTLTLEELETAAVEGRYNNHHHRLHYLRGALLALNWNARIRAASGGDRSLLDAVRDVVVRAEAGGGRIGVPAFVEVLRGYGVDARRDIERHLHRGQPLEPAEDAFGPEWELGSRSAPAFEPGLDLVALVEENQIEGLAPGGEAERTGLREGMRVVDTENAAPWRGRWDPERPTIVVVNEDGSRRRFEVRAAGAAVEIPEFRLTGEGESGESPDASPAVQHELHEASPSPVAITDVNIVPMDTPRVLRGRTVVVRDGIIADMGADGAVEIPENTVRVDGGEGYLLPGLVDSHVHLRSERELISYLIHGVTTIVNLSGTTEEAPDPLRTRARLAKGELVGPSLYTTGPVLDGDPPIFGAVSTVVETPDEARHTVAAQADAGYDFVKVYNNLRPDVLRATVEVAHARGRAVFGHIPRRGGRERALQRAFDAGLDVIAHGEEYFFTFFHAGVDSLLDRGEIPWRDTARIPEAVHLTRRAGAVVIPNLSFVAMTRRQLDSLEAVMTHPEARHLSPVVRDMWERYNPTRRSNLERFDRRERGKYPLVRRFTKALHDAGVPLLLGTDASIPGLYPGHSAHVELRELVAAGLSPYEALAAGTRTAGRFIHHHAPSSAPFGIVAPGHRADLVLVREDPLEDIEHAAAVEGVMVRGVWLSKETLEGLRARKMSIVDDRNR